jgi:hypothetical protein
VTKPDDNLLVEDSFIGDDQYTGKADYVCNSGKWELDERSRLAECDLTPYEQVGVSLAASMDGKWFDYFSDSFTEIGRPWNGNQNLDGFFSPISAGASALAVGGGQDQFPGEGSWGNVAQVLYDDSVYDGIGYFEAPIYEIRGFNLDSYVRGDVSVIGESYVTSVPDNGVVGVVMFQDGVIVGFDFQVDVEVMWRNVSIIGGNDLIYTGEFVVRPDGTFDLEIGEVSNNAICNSTPGFTRCARWDFSGTVVLP